MIDKARRKMAVSGRWWWIAAKPNQWYGFLKHWLHHLSCWCKSNDNQKEHGGNCHNWFFSTYHRFEQLLTWMNHGLPWRHENNSFVGIFLYLFWGSGFHLCQDLCPKKPNRNPKINNAPDWLVILQPGMTIMLPNMLPRRLRKFAQHELGKSWERLLELFQWLATVATTTGDAGGCDRWLLIGTPWHHGFGHGDFPSFEWWARHGIPSCTHWSYNLLCWQGDKIRSGPLICSYLA